MVHSIPPSLTHRGMLRTVSGWRRRCFLCCESCSACGPPRRHVIPFPQSHLEPRALNQRPAAGNVCVPGVCDPSVCCGVSERPLAEWRGAQAASPRAAGHSQQSFPREKACVYIILIASTAASSVVYIMCLMCYMSCLINPNST